MYMYIIIHAYVVYMYMYMYTYLNSLYSLYIVHANAYMYWLCWPPTQEDNNLYTCTRTCTYKCNLSVYPNIGNIRLKPNTSNTCTCTS